MVNKIVCITLMPLSLLAQSSIHTRKAELNKLRLDTLIISYYEGYNKLFPLQTEDKRYTDKLENPISQPHRDKEKNLYQSTLKKLGTIQTDKLPDKSLVDYETLEFCLKAKLSHLNYPWYFLPECSFGNNYTFNRFIHEGSGNHYVTFATVKDYDDFLKRIDIFCTTISDTAIHYMRLGVKRNIVQPKRMMEIVVEDLQKVTVDTLEQNPFYLPILKLPASFSTADKSRLTSLYKEAIQQKLKPAYERAIHFIQTEYIPACRETVGICAYSWGKAYYQDKLDEYYGSVLPPDVLLEKEKAIDKVYEGELKELMKKRGFTQGIDSFYRSFPIDSFRIFKTKEEVLNHYRELQQKVYASLPRYFSVIPKSKLEIVEEPNSTRSGGGRFTSGSEDGARPDRIYFSISDATKYSYAGMARGYLHEGDPGHHFSTAPIVRETASLVGKHEYFEPFHEGWATYAETLGKTLGVYDDDYVYAYFLKYHSENTFWGELENGINVNGYSYEKVMNLFVKHGFPKTLADILIFRSVSMPAQYHAYPIGYLKIIELRDLAKKELGDRFDINEFHWQVLKDGTIPLVVLDNKIHRWITREKGK